MNALENTTVYLAGPVERDIDCNSWRDTITPLLEKLKIRVWSPLIKPDWFINFLGRELTPQEQREDLKHFEQYCYCDHKCNEDILLRNKYVREVCLRLISATDFIICKVDKPTVGTYEELALAKQLNKPVLFLIDKFDSCWRAAQFYNGYNQIAFKNIDDLHNLLKNINNGTYEVDPIQWIFLRNSQGWTK